MAQIDVTLFDGSGNRLTRPKGDILLSVRDGRQTSFHREFVKGPTVTVRTEFPTARRTLHVVLASMKGHRDAGFMPVTVTETGVTPVNLMLLPRQPAFAFASFAAIQDRHAALGRLLSRSFGNGAAAQFETLQSGTTRAPLACLLNIVESLDVLALQNQKHGTLVNYIDRLDLTPALAWLRQDRFFAWVDETIEDAITTSGLFKRRPMRSIRAQGSATSSSGSARRTSRSPCIRRAAGLPAASR